ncbi:MAG: hypothetical protein ABSB57_03645, partial [Dehalococcoidia bacterium]
ANPGEIPGNGIDDDNDGFVDDVNGWNFVDGSNDVQDAIGHGSLVAGVAAAGVAVALGVAVAVATRVAPGEGVSAGVVTAAAVGVAVAVAPSSPSPHPTSKARPSKAAPRIAKNLGIIGALLPACSLRRPHYRSWATASKGERALAANSERIRGRGIALNQAAHQL